MTDKKKNPEDTKDKDLDLDDLLDSALKDFEKTGDEGKGKQKKEEAGDEDDLWNEQFFMEQAKLLLNEKLGAICNSSGEAPPTADQINEGFQKMAEAAAVALNSPVDDISTKYADSISEALKGLKEGADNLQSPVADIADMISGLNLQEGEGSDSNPFIPLMHGLMQSLLSSEILLPSIKELLEKYPQYLEENSSKLSTSDKERYVKQQELFKVICDDLESEKADDSSEVKQERCKRILERMEKLHEYGQPPEDLIGYVETELPGFGGAIGGNSQQQQCPMM